MGQLVGLTSKHITEGSVRVANGLLSRFVMPRVRHDCYHTMFAIGYTNFFLSITYIIFS